MLGIIKAELLTLTFYKKERLRMKDVQGFLREYLAGYTPYKQYWNYEDGCVLTGCIDLYKATGDKGYRDFVMEYLASRVEADGTVPSFDTTRYSLDAINCSRALFFALDETGDARYRKAIEQHMDRLRSHPRCRCGSFWHKEIYPEQVWLDGLYMAQPFYMAYETRFDGLAHVADVVRQFQNARALLFDADKGLSYHACDTAKRQSWADAQTGRSANFWLRAMGWYLMALVDCIELLGPDKLYEHYRMLVDLFRESIRGLLRYQDAETGLFYQVIDRSDMSGNYLETSGSAMVAYAVMKAVRLGVLNDEKYLPLGEKAFRGLVDNKLTADAEGKLHLTDICKAAGLSDERDGSVAYYLSEPRVSDDSKGVGPFMMACAEYAQAEKNV